jgi:hypothetical protein
MKLLVILSCIVALAGCKLLGKKDDAAGDAAASVTSATAPSDSAAPADSTAANTPSHGAPPVTQPGVVTDPNATPSVEGSDTQAHAEINKGNYKKEIESLEKEDLNADKK